METLTHQLQATQHSLEDAMWLEANLEDVTETETGISLWKWLKRRRRVVARVCRILKKF